MIGTANVWLGSFGKRTKEIEMTFSQVCLFTGIDQLITRKLTNRFQHQIAFFTLDLSDSQERPINQARQFCQHHLGRQSFIRADLFCRVQCETTCKQREPPKQEARLFGKVQEIGERLQARQLLAGLFWGEYSEDRARRNLSDALYHLRRGQRPEIADGTTTEHFLPALGGND